MVNDKENLTEQNETLHEFGVLILNFSFLFSSRKIYLMTMTMI